MELTEDENQVFAPDWFRTAYDFQIKGYPINDQVFDTRSGIIEDLTISLEEYDQTKPIVLARSTNPEIRNEVIDGRTRLYSGDRRLKKYGKLPDFTFKWIDVPNHETLAALRAQYELKNRSKSAEVSKAWIEHNVTFIVDSKIDELQDRLPDYIINTLGFRHQKLIRKIYEEVREKRAKNKKQRQENKHGDINEIIKREREKWGINESSNPAGSRGHAEENPNHISSYQWKCPNCQYPLKIVSDSATGSIVKVEAQSKVSKTT
jgi:hypothetical protein